MLVDDPLRDLDDGAFFVGGRFSEQAFGLLGGAAFVVHEQNAIAGLTNKVLSQVADKTMNAFPGALPGAQ